MLVALVAWLAFDRTPAAARSGHGFERPTPARVVVNLDDAEPPAGTSNGMTQHPPGSSGNTGPRRTLRVGTFNLHGGEDPVGAPSLDLAARTIQGLDFVGLQEVRGSTQVQELAATLDLSWCYAPTERRFFHDHFGNAALASIPVDDWRTVPMVGTRGKGYRNYLIAEIPWPVANRATDVDASDGTTDAAESEGVLTVIVTHLDRHQDRVPQLQEVARVFQQATSPAVLMGDLNTLADDPVLKQLLETEGVVNGIAANPELEPVRRLDWILARGLDVTAAGEVDLGASDHPCVWAELSLTDP